MRILCPIYAGQSFVAAAMGGVLDPLPESLCPSCRQPIDIYGGCRCGVRGTDGPGPHPTGSPGVNDDLAAFGEIIVGKHPIEATTAAGSMVSAVRMRELMIEMQSQLDEAHGACDGPVSRMSGERVRSLAERVSALRQMVANGHRYREELKSAADELCRSANALGETVDPGFARIVCFFVGAITGVFIAWGFLSLQ